jgi:inorganic pyrophosphatase
VDESWVNGDNPTLKIIPLSIPYFLGIFFHRPNPSFSIKPKETRHFPHVGNGDNSCIHCTISRLVMHWGESRQSALALDFSLLWHYTHSTFQPKAQARRTMDINKIPAGKNVPYDVNVVIEIPQGGHPIKYELDKDSGALFVDRFVHTSMVYPANYGFIPQTLSEDGDPCDVLVVGQYPVVPGCVIRSRPIGALVMEDESGQDEKILAVPVDKLHPFYSRIQSYKDLPEIMIEQIGHFFEHYKDLEKGKWVKIVEWVGPEEAAELIRKGIEKANSEKKAA